MILQPYITESCDFSKMFQKKFLSQCLNTAVKYSLFLLLASKLFKNSITLIVTWSIKTCHFIFE